jgi:hypothetical protein
MIAAFARVYRVLQRATARSTRLAPNKPKNSQRHGSIALFLAMLCLAPLLQAQTTTPAPSTSSFACNTGTTIAVDFVNSTVTDSIAPNPVPAVITASTISWHYEYDTYQYDPHYGNQIVHHVADYSLNRSTGSLNGASAACTQTAN